jgi:hypothetical protein
MMKLITEMSTNVQLHEGSQSKDLFVVGIFSSAESENNNKRRYRKELLERELGKINTKMESRSLWGELGHPPSPEVQPERIAILVEALEWKGNDVYGRAKVLNTPMGKIAQELVKEGRLGISSRGLGTVGDDGYVNEDYKLITYDLVTDPSNHPSWVNGIYEAETFTVPKIKKDPTPEEIQQIQEQEQMKAARKKYFDMKFKEF